MPAIATAVTATTIGLPATAGTTVQTSRTPVTVRSLARSCNSSASATAGFLKQQLYVVKAGAGSGQDIYHVQIAHTQCEI